MTDSQFKSKKGKKEKKNRQKRWDKQKTKSKMKNLNAALLLVNRMDIWLKEIFRWIKIQIQLFAAMRNLLLS